MSEPGNIVRLAKRKAITGLTRLRIRKGIKKAGLKCPAFFVLLNVIMSS